MSKTNLLAGFSGFTSLTIFTDLHAIGQIIIVSITAVIQIIHLRNKMKEAKSNETVK
jgi:hypothetical protein